MRTKFKRKPWKRALNKKVLLAASSPSGVDDLYLDGPGRQIEIYVITNYRTLKKGCFV